MGKREAAKRLKWLIDFANLNIIEVEPGDFLKELYTLLTSFSDSQVSQKYLIDDQGNRMAMGRTQRMVRQIFSALSGDADQASSLFPFQITYQVSHEDSELKITPRSYWVEGSYEDAPLVIGGQYRDFAVKSGEKVPVLFSGGMCNQDMFSTIGAFLLPILQDLGVARIFRCSGCERFEFTNRKKQKPLCTRCLTKARVEKHRERQRKKYGKAWN